MKGTRQKTWRTCLMVLALAVDLLLIATWVIRPRRIYTEWLARESGDSPITLFIQWMGGHEAPLTPMGLLSIFDPLDLLVVVALLFVFGVLVLLVATTLAGSSLPLLSWVKSRISRPPSVRLGVKAAMIAIAVVGLELGWEINGWETWRLREKHLKQLEIATNAAAGNMNSVRSLRRDLDKGKPSVWAGPEESLTKEAIDANRAASIYRTERELAYKGTILAAYYEGLVRKREQAVAYPREPQDPDPLFPFPELDGHDWLSRRNYRRALDALAEEIRRFPGLWEAHYHRAWILATCPDPQIRDGGAAVQAATRACELTTWKRTEPLDSLAAAYAESGDFKAAIEWEGKALAQARISPVLRMRAQARLALYKAGKPYRDDK